MLKALTYEFSTPDVSRSWFNHCLFGCREVEMTWRSHQKGAFHLQEERRQLNIDNWSAVCHGDWRTVRNTEDWKLLEIVIVMLHPSHVGLLQPAYMSLMTDILSWHNKGKDILSPPFTSPFSKVLTRSSQTFRRYRFLRHFDVLPSRHSFFSIQNFYSAARREGLGPTIRQSLPYG